MPSNLIGRLKLTLAITSLALVLTAFHFLFTLFLPFYFSAILICALFLLSIRLISYTVLFPGSSSIWSSSLQSTFCSQLCLQGVSKLNSVKDLLQSLSQPEVQMNYANLKSASNFIKQVLLIYSKITLTPRQQELETSLKALKENLLSLKVRDRNNKCVSVWTVIDHPEKVRKAYGLEKIGEADAAIINCNKTIDLLSRDQTISLRKVIFGGDLLLGDLRYQRADFFSRFNAEEIKLRGQDGVEFDCAFVSPEESKSENSAIVYCCPNGGYFEYIYYQTDWLEFYLRQNLSIFLWNYRGYGLSQGRPSIKSIEEDGKTLIQYAREVKKFRKIVVHGESLGGAIASSIALSSNVDFLIADRTFSNIYSVFSSYAGPVIAFLAVLVGPQNINCKQNFLDFNNRKILTCDINDEVIPIQASLKHSLVEDYPSRLQKSSIKKFENALKTLSGLKKKYAKERRGKNLILDNGYASLNTEDTEVTIENFFSSVLAIFSKVDAAGHKLSWLIDDSKMARSWLKALEVWGSSPVTYGEGFYDLRTAALERLRNYVNSSSKILYEYEILNNAELRKAVSAFSDLEQVLSERLSYLENTRLFDDRNGMLIILKCGHCGSYDKVEKYVLEKLISKNLIID